jgi:hypothetical protein
MFELLFGGKRKIELIRELVEQRMREAGFVDIESRIKGKLLSNLELIGTPEGAIVTIIETVNKLQGKILLEEILISIEDHRKKLGEDGALFSDILKISKEADANLTVSMYVHYRISVEAPGRMNDEQVRRAIEQTIAALR